MYPQSPMQLQWASCSRPLCCNKAHSPKGWNWLFSAAFHPLQGLDTHRAPNAATTVYLTFIFLESNTNRLPLLKVPNFLFFFLSFSFQSELSQRAARHGVWKYQQTTGDCAREGSLKTEKVTGSFSTKRVGADKDGSRGALHENNKMKSEHRKRQKNSKKKNSDVYVVILWNEKNRPGCHFDWCDFSLGEAACLIKLFWNLQELSVNQM